MLTGIREPELLDLADELLRVGPIADQLDMDLMTAQTLSGLTAPLAVGVVRDIAEAAAPISNHLRWIHDELSTFRIDPYLRAEPVVSVARDLPRRIVASAAAASEFQLAGADALWSSQQARPPIEQRTRGDFALIADAVAARVDNPQRRAMAMAMTHSGISPTEAIRRALAEPLHGPSATSSVDHHEVASQALVAFAEHELGDPRYSDLHHSRLELDTSPDGRPARAAVGLAQFASISVGSAAAQIAAAITRPPWIDDGASQAYTAADNVRGWLIQEWIEVLLVAPMNATPAHLSAMLVDRAPTDNATQTAALLLLADSPLRTDFPLETAELAVQIGHNLDGESIAAIAAARASDLRERTNAIASSVGVLSGLLRPAAVSHAVSSAATYVTAATMFEAWAAGDTDQLTEMVMDSAAPQIARFLIGRFLPVIAGPAGVLLAVVLIATTSEGPRDEQPPNPPVGGYVDEFGRPIEVLYYSNPAGVPDVVHRRTRRPTHMIS